MTKTGDLLWDLFVDEFNFDLQQFKQWMTQWN